MIDTSRIQTGFDVELQLGGGWFRTALQALADHGELLPDPPPPPIPPGAAVEVTEVEVVFDPPERDLRIALTIAGFPLQLLATLELSADGTELLVTTDMPGVETTVPFDALDGLAHVPSLTKVPAADGNDAAIVLLANLDIQTVAQNQEPLPDGEFEARGDAAAAVSFLPAGRDSAVGVGRPTFGRFANDIWHGELTADDGSHPMPSAEDAVGTWRSAKVEPRNGKIRITLVGDVPADSPIIDVIPDPVITVTVELTPAIRDGAVTFTMKVDTDIDTGLLGDIFAAVIGGLIGFLIGLAVGAPLLGAGIGAAIGVVVLEAGEAIVEGIVQRRIVAELEDGPPPPLLSCDRGVVVEATPPDEGGIALGAIGTIPRSIPIHVDQPDPLHERQIVVSTNYEELAMNADGMAFAGTAATEELFTPLRATLVRATRDPASGALTSLEYRGAGGARVELPMAEVEARLTELRAPLLLLPRPAGSTIRIPNEKLASVCLVPTAIRRANTVVTDIRFSTGLELRVPEAVGLQDGAAIVLEGLQLIHPSNARPYFRAPADESTENNFESLPRF